MGREIPSILVFKTQLLMKGAAVLKNNKGGMVVVTTDGGAGSSGKGSLNSWLADKNTFHLATNNWMSNAGHFTELDDGRRILVQHIPSSFVDPNVELYINAGASIDLDILWKEIEMLESEGFPVKNRLTIHPHANVITEQNKKTEKELLKSGSTFKGCGASLAQKALRQQVLAKDYEELRPYIKDRTLEINEGISKGMSILVEGSQGIDLDLNHAEYPFVTSRSTIPAQLVADAGIAMQAVTNVIINLRTNPIRINNQSAANEEETCYSGNYWGAKEISWEDVAQQAGYSWEEFSEKYSKSLFTSVTKKIRRVFEFPVERFKYVHALSGGYASNNVLYSLNFANFIDKNVEGAKTLEEVMTPKVKEWINKNIYSITGEGSLKWIRTGPKHSEIVELE